MASMMIDGSLLHYVEEGSGSPVILLHGWGQNIAMMKPIADHLKQSFHVVTIDFPGFGESEEPKTPYGVTDYANVLATFLKQLNIENPILIGHSFGCRVAIHYAAAYPVEKMILTGPAGLRNKRGIRYYLRLFVFKTLKRVVHLPMFRQYEDKLRRKFGSSDYNNTSGVMRSTFVKVVNDDVKPLLPKLLMPVLLVLGDKDDAIPLWMGKTMEKLIPNAGLAIFEDAGHYAYLEQLARFLKVCDVFL